MSKDLSRTSLTTPTPFSTQPSPIFQQRQLASEPSKDIQKSQNYRYPSVDGSLTDRSVVTEAQSGRERLIVGEAINDPQVQMQSHLKSPFASRVQSGHLPTPQSPNSLGQFAPRTSESPIAHSQFHAGPNYNRQLVGPNIDPMSDDDGDVDMDLIATPARTIAQTVTPDTSPMPGQKGPPEYSGHRTTSPPRTPPRAYTRYPSLQTDSPTVMQVDADAEDDEFLPSPHHRSESHSIASPTSAISHITSRLSSPFEPRPASVDMDDMDEPRTPSPPPPPPSSLPTQTASSSSIDATNHRPLAAGGEIDRIRAAQQQSLVEAIKDAEARRPDYLRRNSRKRIPLIREPPTTPSSARHTSSVPLGMGITETPMRGRRLELWGIQETSEESFEERLMAGGYGGYGSTIGPGDAQRPKTPPNGNKLASNAGAGGYSVALEWASMITPGPAGSSKPIEVSLAETSGTPGGGFASVVGGRAGGVKTERKEPVMDEREMRKRRRLEAFKKDMGSEDGVNEIDRRRSRLVPVEMEGRGRVLMDVSLEETSDILEGNAPQADAQSPGSKKKPVGKNRKRKGGPAAIAATSSAMPVKAGAKGAGKGKAKEEWKIPVEDPAAQRNGAPNWPDSEFPWSLRLAERKEREEREEREKMRLIERFLETPSDGEESDEEAHPSANGVIPFDPADARAAFLSKKTVRALFYGRQLGMEFGLNDSDDDEDRICFCRGRDDGREMVQCDDCKVWYHLECIGVRDVHDLGDEKDPWYCRRCVLHRSGDLYDRLPSSEPTFAPTDEELTPHRQHATDPLLFHSSPLQESPGFAEWSPRKLPAMPTTPTRGSGISGRNALEFPSRSSWTSSSASRRGPPATPRTSAHHVQIYTTPTPGQFHHDFSPLDPTSTPSRGLRFPPSFTPKSSSNSWTGPPRTTLFQTPAAAPAPMFGKYASFPRRTNNPSNVFAPYNQRLSAYPQHVYHREDGGHSVAPLNSSPLRGQPTWFEDDTPVDHSVPRPGNLPRRLPVMPESPLAGRG